MLIGPELPMAALWLVQIPSSSKAEFSRSFAEAETFGNIRSLLPRCYGLVLAVNSRHALRETPLLELVPLFQRIPSIKCLALRPSHWASNISYNSNSDHQLSLGTIVRVFPTWGSNEFRTQHATGDIRLAADWQFAPKLSLNPNVGIARYEDDDGKLFTAGLFATTLNYLPTKKLNPFVDLGIQAPEMSDGQTAAILDSGIAYIIGQNLQLDASVGTRVHGETAPRPFLSFGISWRWKPQSRLRSTR